MTRPAKDGASKATARHAAEGQLAYWQQQRDAARLAGDAARVAQCEEYVAQCELMLSGLRDAASGGLVGTWPRAPSPPTPQPPSSLATRPNPE